MRKREEADRIASVERYRAAARLFSCPTCGADVGQKCVGARSKERVSVHQARGDLTRPRRRYEDNWASQIEVVGDEYVEGYVTYGIRHKATGPFGYIGQTGNFAKPRAWRLPGLKQARGMLAERYPERRWQDGVPVAGAV